MPDPLVIGADVGGTKMMAAAVDSDLGVHGRVDRLTPTASLSEVLDTVVGAIELARASAPGPVAAVGLGIPCLIDERFGEAVMSVHLPIAGVPFGLLVAERIGLPVHVDNDANMAMLAEHRAGAAMGTGTAVMLTLGTGIGGGLVIGGELFRGAFGAGAELGHIVVDFDGPPCHDSCPGRGCLEAFASGTALGGYGMQAAAAAPHSALGRALDEGRTITGALVTELALEGDGAARTAVARLGERLGFGIVSLVNIFNPELVVIGGGVIAAGDLLLGPARAVVAERALSPSRELARIVPAHFGAEAGMLGAAMFARERGAGTDLLGSVTAHDTRRTRAGE